MGAVSIQTYNVQLMSIANYDNRNQLKNLYHNYYQLEELAEQGDSVACSIFVDLKTALFHPSVLTDNQRESIILHLIKGMTIKQVSQDLNKSESTIHESVNGGLKRIQKALREGEIFRERGTKKNRGTHR